MHPCATSQTSTTRPNFSVLWWKKELGKSSWTDRLIYQPAEQAVELRGPQLKNSGCLITEPDHADWSMQLPVIPVFCLAVWFLSGDKAAGTARTTGRLKGHRAKEPELRWQILCRFRACLLIVCVCLLAFIHVCGPVPCVVMSFWVHDRRLLVYLFSALAVRQTCLTPAASCVGTGSFN